ncbi:MAG: NUDIX domain-containing protein [Patescibacteria group bacterium]
MDNPDKNQHIKVGLGVMLFKDGKVLLGKRRGSHGEGEYAWPGGHLEYMESIADCTRREVREETGMEITNIRFLRLLNLKKYAPQHYVDIGMIADWKSGEPQVLEPNRIECWDWYRLDSLPAPLFGTTASYLEALKSGKNFFDF